MMNRPSTRSLIVTMTLFTVALSRTPSSSSQVMAATIRKAGTLIRIGMPATWGAVWSRRGTGLLSRDAAVHGLLLTALDVAGSPILINVPAFLIVAVIALLLLRRAAQVAEEIRR